MRMRQTFHRPERDMKRSLFEARPAGAEPWQSAPALWRLRSRALRCRTVQGLEASRLPTGPTPVHFAARCSGWQTPGSPSWMLLQGTAKAVDAGPGRQSAVRDPNEAGHFFRQIATFGPSSLLQRWVSLFNSGWHATTSAMSRRRTLRDEAPLPGTTVQAPPPLPSCKRCHRDPSHPQILDEKGNTCRRESLGLRASKGETSSREGRRTTTLSFFRHVEPPRNSESGPLVYVWFVLVLAPGRGFKSASGISCHFRWISKKIVGRGRYYRWSRSCAGNGGLCKSPRCEMHVSSVSEVPWCNADAGDRQAGASTTPYGQTCHHTQGKKK